MERVLGADSVPILSARNTRRPCAAFCKNRFTLSIALHARITAPMNARTKIASNSDFCRRVKRVEMAILLEGSHFICTVRCIVRVPESLTLKEKLEDLWRRPNISIVGSHLPSESDQIKQGTRKQPCVASPSRWTERILLPTLPASLLRFLNALITFCKAISHSSCRLDKTL